VSGVIVTEIERERQRSGEGEIRIKLEIDPADHEDKKVKNMLTLVLQAPTHWIVV
jgi:hypothetical protein